MISAGLKSALILSHNCACPDQVHLDNIALLGATAVMHYAGGCLGNEPSSRVLGMPESQQHFFESLLRKGSHV